MLVLQFYAMKTVWQAFLQKNPKFGGKVFHYSSQEGTKDTHTFSIQEKMLITQFKAVKKF